MLDHSRTWKRSASVKTQILVGVLVAAALGITGNAGAHHPQSMFMETPVWLKGTILRYRPADPHVMIELEEKRSDGTTLRWIVEGPNMGRFGRILKDNGGVAPREFLRVGDTISTCGFTLRKAFPPDRMYTDWPPEEERFVHGQLLVMPDGSMLSWGPYGRLDNCVRKSDGSRYWIDFLNRDRRAHDQWCAAQSQRNLKQLQYDSLLDEVSRAIDMPCR